MKRKEGERGNKRMQIWGWEGMQAGVPNYLLYSQKTRNEGWVRWGWQEKKGKKECVNERRQNEPWDGCRGLGEHGACKVVVGHHLSNMD